MIPLWAWPLVILRLAAMLGALALHVIAYYLLAPFTRRNPVPTAFLRTLGAIAGLRVTVTGTPAGRKTFFLSNHVSWLDIPALAGRSGTAFVAHDGLAGIGALRILCEMNDTVFVARHDRSTISRQIEQVREALADTGALTIFPEGTTSDGTGLLPFRSSLLSALEADADHIPVQPVWLDYGQNCAKIAWVGEEPGLANALRILAKVRRIPLTIHFLEPLSPENRRDRKHMAKAARETIAAAMHRTTDSA